MNEPNEIPPKQNYRWPWFVLAAILLFIVLGVVFVSFKAREIQQERNFDTLPGGTSAH